jgi:asparagine synthase (glutamine-hydrolysing)
MCGINGKITDRQELISKELIHRMNELIAYRGPDAEGIELFRDRENIIGFGHRRLKIIDLSDSANQPFFSPDKNIILVFNGEIYNFLELKNKYFAEDKFVTNSDTEIVLKMYQKFGIEMVKELRGMFAIALYDKISGKLFLVRDHLGKKPLFYCHQGKTLIFSSQLKSIVANQEIKKELDLAVVDDYLSFGYVPGQQCIYKGIYKLQPGSYLEFSNGQVAINRFWRLDYTNKLSVNSEEELINNTEKLIEEAVKLRLISDVPLGAFLSGGIDSSLIVALMAKHLPQVCTFSIGFEQADFNELKYAKMIADKFKTKHTEFVVKPNAIEIIPELLKAFDEPYADPSQIPMYYLSKLTKQHVTVALNGDGGDECFAGYERYQAMLAQLIYRAVPRPLRQGLYEILKKFPENTAHTSILRRIKWLTGVTLSDNSAAYLNSNRCFDDRLKAGIYTAAMKETQAKGQGDGEFMSYFNSDTAQKLVDKLLNTDTNTYLPQDLLVKGDRSTMLHALEGRSPLLDCRLMEYAASIPPKYKIHNFQLKYLLKKVAGKHLPHEVIYRRKQGFGIPLGSWFRNELQDYILDTFADSVLVKNNILEKNALDHVIYEHLSGKANHGRRIFTLLMLEKWLAR